MDRRKVLKKIGYGSTALIVSPQILNMLHSCQSSVNKNLPVFFTKIQFQIISKTMELIIPKTDIPGSTELMLPEFLDNYVAVVMSQNDKENLSKGINNFIKLILIETKKNHSSEINTSDLNIQLKKYLKASEKQIEIWQRTYEFIGSKAKDDFLKSQESEVYNFLIQIRSLTLNAFRVNEYIGEEVLAYDPIPGKGKGCVDLNQTTGGKRWSL
jgi:hypothetical protein